MTPLRHPTLGYAITVLHSVPDDARHLELDVVRGQRALVTAIVPDEDPAREPTVCFDPRGRHRDVPYEVLRWFLHHVDEEIRTSRTWMRLRPDLVAVVHRLRGEHSGIVSDADFPAVLAEVRAVVPATDLPVVLAAAFGRHPDGTVLESTRAFALVHAAAAGDEPPRAV
jgi:hypothetical protein